MGDTPSSTPQEWSELRKLLRTYLLSSDNSLLAAATESIIQAKWGGLPVTVFGVEGPSLGRIVKVLGALDIENTVYIYRGTGVDAAVKEHRERRSGQSRATIRVPYSAARFSDYELLIPFCIERTVAEMAGRGLTVTVPDIESLYLIYLRAVSVYSPYDDVENRIKMDVAKAIPHGVLSPVFALSEDSGLIGNMYHHLMEMSHKALLYLGCHPGNIGYGTIESAVDDHVSKALNEYGQKASYATSTAYLTSRGRSPSSYPTFPKVVWSYRYSLSQMSTVVSNVNSTELVGYVPSSGIWQVWKKDKARIPLKVVECLKLRLCGKTEPEVCERLGFREQSDYESWLRENCIDLEPRHSHSVYQKWLEAEKKLGMSTSGNSLVAEQSDRGEDRVEIQTDRGSKVTWDKIGFRYIDNNTIHVHWPGQTKPKRYSYRELGFENEANKEPTILWEQFLGAILNNGILPCEESWDKKKKDTRKTAKRRIKETLIEAFHISDDPFERYQRNFGWKLKSEILRSLIDQDRLDESMLSIDAVSERELASEKNDLPDRKVGPKRRPK